MLSPIHSPIHTFSHSLTNPLIIMAFIKTITLAVLSIAAATVQASPVASRSAAAAAPKCDVFSTAPVGYNATRIDIYSDGTPQLVSRFHAHGVHHGAYAFPLESTSTAQSITRTSTPSLRFNPRAPLLTLPFTTAPTGCSLVSTPRGHPKSGWATWRTLSTQETV